MSGEDKGKGKDPARLVEINSDDEEEEVGQYDRERQEFDRTQELRQNNAHYAAVMNVQDSFNTQGYLTPRQYFQLNSLIDPSRTMGVTDVGTQAAMNLMYQSRNLVGASLREALYGQAGHAYQTGMGDPSSGATWQPWVPVNTLNQPQASTSSASSVQGAGSEPRGVGHDAAGEGASSNIVGERTYLTPEERARGATGSTAGGSTAGFPAADTTQYPQVAGFRVRNRQNQPSRSTLSTGNVATWIGGPGAVTDNPAGGFGIFPERRESIAARADLERLAQAHGAARADLREAIEQGLPSVEIQRLQQRLAAAVTALQEARTRYGEARSR